MFGLDTNQFDFQLLRQALADGGLCGRESLQRFELSRLRAIRGRTGASAEVRLHSGLQRKPVIFVVVGADAPINNGTAMVGFDNLAGQ